MVDTTASVGRFPRLALVGGNPAIYFWQPGTSDVRYRRSATATGASSGDWSSSVDIETSGTNSGNNDFIGIINGNPAVIYYNFTNPSDFLRYNRSSTANGTAGADWTANKFNLETSNGSGSWISFGLDTVGGFPATVYLTGSNLYYRRGTNADGSIWAASISIASAAGIGFHGRLALIDDNPAVAYNSNLNTLRYRRSSSATGDGAGDWMTVETVDDSGVVGFFVKLIKVGGKPAVCYSDSTNSATKYAIRL